jgi:catechol 2,3-dioxygenase-like lactoylglutathione lyase family enzyme
MRYAHTNIIARDWKCLSDFYTRVFGCIVKPPQRNLSGDWLDRATGLHHAKLEGVHLILPGYGDHGPTLEIFTYADTRTREPLMANHAGFAHIAFEVEDVESTFARALDQGGTALGQPSEKAIEGIGMLKLVYLRDPEGNIIEIQSWK